MVSLVWLGKTSIRARLLSIGGKKSCAIDSGLKNFAENEVERR